MQKFAETIPDDNTMDISIKDYMKLTETTKGRLTGFKSECVEWASKKVELDPYVLGLWLGDGYQHGYILGNKSWKMTQKFMIIWLIGGINNDATLQVIQDVMFVEKIRII